MQYTVPQFIEREAKVVGPFTFKQFIYIGIAGGACFVLYFSVPFYLFLIATVILGGGAMALAFLKIGGRSLPVIIMNLFTFSASPKIYIWKKKMLSPKIVKKEKPEEEEVEKGPSLKISEKSLLKKLSTEVETRTK